jgi:T-complex protein 1 subunit gamma
MKISNNIEYQQLIQIIQIIGEFFKSSFGPKGLDKLLMDHANNDLLVTNDGGAILQDLTEYLNPEISKFVLNWGKILKRRQNDGIKSFYILFGEIMKIVSQLNDAGVSKFAIIEALRQLELYWMTFSKEKCFHLTKGNEFHTVKSILSSMLKGKISDVYLNVLLDIVIDVLSKVQDHISAPWFDCKDYIQTHFVPGSQIIDSVLLDGIVMDKLPVNTSFLSSNEIINPKILLIRQKLYIDLPDGGDIGPKGSEFIMEFNDPVQLLDLKNQNNTLFQKWFDKIREFSPDVIITEKGVNRFLESKFTINNILLIRRAKAKEFNYVSRYLGIVPIDDVMSISSENIGTAQKLVIKKFGRNDQIVIYSDSQLINKTKSSQSSLKSNMENKKVKEKPSFFQLPSLGTIVIGGRFWNVCEEIERYFNKLIHAGTLLLRNRKFFYGGGNTEIRFWNYVNKICDSKFALEKAPNPHVLYAIKELVQGVKIFPKILINSCGMDVNDGIPQMTSALSLGNDRVGIDVNQNQISNMDDQGIYDNFSAKTDLIRMVFEISRQLTRIDRIIKKKKKV